MATYTENYSLVKPGYGDQADIDVLNRLMTDKVDALLFENRRISADEYDQEESYAVGDYAIYENVLYRCLENTTGNFDPSKWEMTNLANEVATKGEGGADVTKTASGNPIEITDGASAPLVKCDVTITGSQDLHGYDKPWVGGAGKNKLPLVLADIKSANTTGTWSGNTYTISNAIFTVNTDDGGNVVSIIGKGNGSAGNALSLPFTLSAGSYILSSGFAEMNGTNDTFLQSNGVTIARGNSGSPGQSFTLSQDSSCNWFFRVASTVDYVCTPMIRLSTETDSTFAPYSNICPITAYTEGEIEVMDGDGNITTHTTTYPSAIYRGSEDVVNGEVTNEYELVTFNGSENWDGNAKVHGIFLPEKYRVSQIPIANEFQGTSPKYSSAFNDGEIALLPNFEAINVSMPYNQTAQEFNQWLSEHPLQVVLKLATPTTSSVTPTNLPIKSLSGYTHIESATGDMEVEYITEEYQPIVDLISNAITTPILDYDNAVDLTLPDATGYTYIMPSDGVIMSTSYGSVGSTRIIYNNIEISQAYVGDSWTTQYTPFGRGAEITIRRGASEIQYPSGSWVKFIPYKNGTGGSTLQSTPTRSLNLTKSAVTEEKDELPDEIKNAPFEEKPDYNEADDSAPTEVDER